MTNLPTDFAVRAEGFFGGAATPVARRLPAMTMRRRAIFDGVSGLA